MRRLQALAFRLIRYLPMWMIKWAVFFVKRKYVIGVVGIVPNRRGEVLFLHHTYRRSRPWRLPGGLKERHEEPFATAERELLEEAGVSVRALQVVGVHQADITLDIVVLCELVREGVFTPNAEVDGLMWVDVANAPFEVPHEQVGMIQRALEIHSQ